MKQLTLEEKYTNLLQILSSYGRAVICFSAGVDSTLLLYAAKKALGANMIAVTASLSSFPQRELKEAIDYCKSLDVEHVIVPSAELTIPGFAENPANRCYLCKSDLFDKIQAVAEQYQMPVIAEGSNVDDDQDYRPGYQAVLEHGVKSPLKKTGLTKAEIRALSKELNLPTWGKPAYACLSSRIPYGEQITEEKLQMIDAGEQYLMDQGFQQMRVRMHGDHTARIELEPEDIDRFLQRDFREEVYEAFRNIGFTYVSLDLMGYRKGSGNEVISS